MVFVVEPQEDIVMDRVSLLLSLAGGVTMGTYPVPIKARSVREANVHPLIFQCYKAFWVFVCGFLFLIPNLIAGRSPVFEFTWWAVVSTAAWIPAGIFTIAAVPRIGLGMVFVLNAGTSSMLSFLVFWLLLDERMTLHSFWGYSFYLAPVYLTSMLAGLMMLVSTAAAPSLAKVTNAGTRDHVEENAYDKAVKPPSGKGDWIAGVVMAVAGGVCAATQAGAVTVGRRHAMRSAGCNEMAMCPLHVQESFNACGSWMTSFGIGTALVTCAVMLVVTGHHWWHGTPVPSLCLGVMWKHGSISGILWVVGNFFITSAIARGGNSIVVPICSAVTIITSGLWGLLYYQEVTGKRQILQWCRAAFFTLACMLLLSHERS